LQQLALVNSIRMIKLQQPRGRAPDRGERLNLTFDQLKMVRPAILARLKRGTIWPVCGSIDAMSLPLKPLQTAQERARFISSVGPPCFSAMM